MAPIKRGQRVRYDGVVPWLKDKIGSVTGWTRRGYISVRFEHGLEHCAPCFLQLIPKDKK